MQTLVHISDLHFGAEAPPVVEGLVTAITDLRPDLVLVSGDLTQRARPREFQAARAFLDRLPGARLVVPGNHDVPLYDLFSRFFRPLAGYKKVFGSESLPLHETADYVVVGIPSVRSLTVAEGRLSPRRVRDLAERLRGVPADKSRLLVLHHPIDAAGRRGRGGARKKHVAFPEIAELRLDLVLSGHLHTPDAAVAEKVHTDATHKALLVAAGTACSWRVRGGQPNSFNVLRLDRELVEVERWDWLWPSGPFERAETRSFPRR